MDLVEVDVLQAERPQALLHPMAKPGATRVAHQTLLGHAESSLGGDHELVAVLPELVAKRLPQQTLRSAEPVGLRRVEDVDAELTRPPDRGDGLALIEAAPLAALVARCRTPAVRPRVL